MKITLLALIALSCVPVGGWPDVPALQPATVEIRLGKLDGKTSDRLSVPGTFTALQNLEMRRTGRYQRRPGTKVLTTVLDGAEPARVVHDHNDETIIATSDTLYSRFGGANENRGALTSWTTSHRPVVNSSVNQQFSDMVLHAGYFWTVWAESTGIYYAVIDQATGAYKVGRTALAATATYSAPRVVAVGSWVLVAYVDVAGSTLRCKKIPTATPDTPSAEATVEAALGGFGYDVLSISATEATFAYYQRNVTDFGRVRRWDVSTMAAAATVTEGASVPAVGSATWSVVRYDAAAGYHLVRFKPSAGGNTAKVQRVTVPTDLSTFTATTLEDFGAGNPSVRAVTGWVDGSSTQHVLAEINSDSAGSARERIKYYTCTSGGAVTVVATRWGFRLVGRVWSWNSRQLALVTATADSLSGPSRSTLYVVRADSWLIEGRALIHTTVNTRGVFGTLPATQAKASGSGFWVAAGYFPATNQVGVTIVSLDFDYASSRWFEFGGMTIVPGSWPRAYDGIGVSEVGFELPPDIASLTAVGGGTLGAGTYWYRACYAWVDGAGQLHRGEPSEPASVVVAAGQRVEVKVETLVATLKRPPPLGTNQNPTIEYYRSVANPSSASDAAYYRVDNPAGSFQGFSINDPTVDYITYTDDCTDANLVANERLYTLGERVLANTATPALQSMASYGSRMWGWDGQVLYFSKLRVDGFGTAFTDTSFLTVYDEFGDGVALANAGDRLLAFKKRAIYSVTGDGPDDTGNGQFSQVDRMELPLGARSSKTVLETEKGVFFQDDQTGQIWLIGQGGPVYVGAAIQTAVDAVTLTGALYVPSRRQARFYSSTGTTFVYDLFHDLWTTFTGQSAIGAGSVNGIAHYVTAAGEVRYDDETSWTEGRTGDATTGTPYQSVMEVAWVSFAKIGGYQRLWVLSATGEKLGTHTVAVKMSYRFGTLAATDLGEVATASMLDSHGYRIEARPAIRDQAATAFKVRIEDNSPKTAGFAIDAMLAEIGVDSKRSRLPSAHRTSTEN